MQQTRPPFLRRISDFLDYYVTIQPDVDFLLHAERRLTYRETQSEVSSWAKALLAAGVRRGDRVAVYGMPHPDFLVIFLATVGIGGVFLGLNPKYTVEELAYNVSDSSSRVLIGLLGDQRENAMLRALIAVVDQIEYVVAPTGSAGIQSTAEFKAMGSAVGPDRVAKARAEVDPSDPAALVYTSGSTGRPKGALLPHRGLVTCCIVQHEHWVTFEPLRVVCDMPINHVGALGDICCSTLVSGGVIYFLEKFDPAELLRTFERERITMWFAIPTMILLATRTPEWNTVDLSSLRRVVWSGAAAPEALISELQRLDVPLSTSYGMTETIGSVTYTSDDDPIEELSGTVGKADPRYVVSVVNEDGTECDIDEQGELVVQGDCLMLGYLNRPEATSRAIRNGRLYTGDVAVRRSDGNFEVVGRLSDTFKSGGYNVYCREVEFALEKHPAVQLATLVPVPDAIYGEVGHAFLLTTDDTILESDALRAFLREHLANYKIPKAFSILHKMPRLPIGKIDRENLRTRAAQLTGCAQPESRRPAN